MMANKWVQASLTFGVAIGVFIGGWLPAIHPMIFLPVSIIIGIWAMWLTANVRGTDGWGGPYHGPDNNE